MEASEIGWRYSRTRVSVHLHATSRCTAFVQDLSLRARLWLVTFTGGIRVADFGLGSSKEPTALIDIVDLNQRNCCELACVHAYFAPFDVPFRDDWVSETLGIGRNDNCKISTARELHNYTFNNFHWVTGLYVASDRAKWRFKHSFSAKWKHRTYIREFCLHDRSRTQGSH